MDDKNVHADHRERMRSKYEKHGEEVFDSHELLEMLLYHSLRREDTNPIAHNFLKSHPDGAMYARSSAEYCDVDGIGENSANLLRLSKDTTIRFLCESLKEEPMCTAFKQQLYLWLWMRNKKQSSVAALLLDKKYRYIDCVLLASGKNVRSDDYAGMLVFEMKRYNASVAVLCHNHRDNTAVPSPEDYMLTAMIDARLEKEGLRLEAHYIVTQSNCVECSRRSLGQTKGETACL